MAGFKDICIGRCSEFCNKENIKAGIAELFSTFFFVFVGEGSSIAYVELSGSSSGTPLALLIAAVCHGFAIYAAITISFHVSGGHVNPAVTIGLFFGGNITLVKSVLYIVMQLVGAALASALLLYVTNGASLPVHDLASGLPIGAGLVFEISMTFLLLYIIYATCVDPATKSTKSSAPLTVGLAVAALILAGGPFTSASMNPARSFGPALIAWTWTNHWIYWIGPLLGGAIAGLLYPALYFSNHESGHVLLPSDE